MKVSSISRLLVVAVLFAAVSAKAALVTGTPSNDPAVPFPTPLFGTLIDFDDGTTNTALAANRYVGVGVTSIANTLGPQLGFFPSSQSDPNYIGTGFPNSWDADILVEFTALQAAVGIGIAGPTRLLFALLDGSMNILETYDVDSPTNTYYYINRASADAKFLRVAGDFVAIDDLQFGTRTVVVPEPGVLALLGLALVGLAAARRRKHSH